jgi:hypothetical protein
MRHGFCFLPSTIDYSGKIDLMYFSHLRFFEPLSFCGKIITLYKINRIARKLESSF